MSGTFTVTEAGATGGGGTTSEGNGESSDGGGLPDYQKPALSGGSQSISTE